MSYFYTGFFNKTTREVYFEDEAGRQIVCALGSAWSGNETDLLGASTSGSTAHITTNTVTGPETYQFDLDTGSNIARML